MILTINHKEEQFEAHELPLGQLLDQKELTFKRVLIRVNGKVINEDEKGSTILNDGDQVDIVRIISGG